MSCNPFFIDRPNARALGASMRIHNPNDLPIRHFSNSARDGWAVRMMTKLTIFRSLPQPHNIERLRLSFAAAATITKGRNITIVGPSIQPLRTRPPHERTRRFRHPQA